ncbi:MAG TPA: DUF167 domain-containing protein [Actinomycetota bacterium]|nr:DUF167 domain-containing protein [Actinomycetota bacterium]
MRAASFVANTREGVVIELFVQPRAAQDAIVGIHGTALKVKVRAVPDGGRANRAVEALVAEVLGVPPSAASIVRGGGSRHKRMTVVGVDAERVLCELENVLSSPAHEPGQEARAGDFQRANHQEEDH